MTRYLVLAWACLLFLTGALVAQPDAPTEATSDAASPAAEPAASDADEPDADEPDADESETDEAEPADDDSDDDSSDDAPADEDAPLDEADTESEPADPAAEQDFDKLFSKWKDLLAQLRELALKYKTAKPEARPEIKAQYQQLLDEGRAMEASVKTGAEKAYIAAPGKNPELGNFLASLVKSDVASDSYEEALRRAEILIKHDFENKRVYGLAGVAAFNVNQFDKAEKYLKTAEESIALDDVGRHDLKRIDEYREIWAKEKKIRDAEAKADDLPRVLLQTNKGDVVVELFENEAPLAVANFIHLVSRGFYDGLTFHRVLPGFMAQGGDPKGDGTGGPGYTIPCECYEENHRLHFRGSLSMAHAGRDTGGSQFFLTFVATQHLDGKHTVFGRVIEGFDVLGKLQKIDPTNAEAGNVTPDKIVKATVLRKRDHEYEPTKASTKE